MGRVFANGLEDLGSIPGCVIPKILKMVLDTSLLSTQQYKVLLRVKWSNPGKGVALSPTPWCSSYWKGSLLVALNYGQQYSLSLLSLYLTYQLFMGYLKSKFDPIVNYDHDYIFNVTAIFYKSLICLFYNNHLFAHCCMVSSILLQYK